MKKNSSRRKFADAIKNTIESVVIFVMTTTVKRCETDRDSLPRC